LQLEAGQNFYDVLLTRRSSYFGIITKISPKRDVFLKEKQHQQKKNTDFYEMIRADEIKYDTRKVVFC
jgi:hypothetical protein